MGKDEFSTIILAWNKASGKQVACKVMDNVNQRWTLEDFDRRQHVGGIHVVREPEKERQHQVDCIQWNIKRFSREFEVLQDLCHVSLFDIMSGHQTSRCANHDDRITLLESRKCLGQGIPGIYIAPFPPADKRPDPVIVICFRS